MLPCSSYFRNSSFKMVQTRNPRISTCSCRVARMQQYRSMGYRELNVVIYIFSTHEYCHWSHAIGNNKSWSWFFNTQRGCIFHQMGLLTSNLGQHYKNLVCKIIHFWEYFTKKCSGLIAGLMLNKTESMSPIGWVRVRIRVRCRWVRVRWVWVLSPRKSGLESGLESESGLEYYSTVLQTHGVPWKPLHIPDQKEKLQHELAERYHTVWCGTCWKFSTKWLQKWPERALYRLRCCI